VIQLQRWIYWSVLITLIALSAQNIYQGVVIADQKQTIEQYMGLQHGKHDGPEMPAPEGKPTYLITPQREQNSI
jgi:hypothetical protein